MRHFQSILVIVMDYIYKDNLIIKTTFHITSTRLETSTLFRQ
jgi:hypothetical protein